MILPAGKVPGRVLWRRVHTGPGSRRERLPWRRGGHRGPVTGQPCGLRATGQTGRTELPVGVLVDDPNAFGPDRRLGPAPGFGSAASGRLPAPSSRRPVCATPRLDHPVVVLADAVLVCPYCLNELPPTPRSYLFHLGPSPVRPADPPGRVGS